MPIASLELIRETYLTKIEYSAQQNRICKDAMRLTVIQHIFLTGQCHKNPTIFNFPAASCVIFSNGARSYDWRKRKMGQNKTAQ
jgi:hypothetical protein